MDHRIYILLIIFFVAFYGCKKPYLPPVTTSGQSLLVVEGVINTGADSTIIHLSHTIPISLPTGAVSPPELNATVIVQSDANASYTLTDAGNGYYSSASLHLNAASKYRLQITTADKKVYQSDFVAAKNSPPIDSVSYQFTNNSLQINVNAHDPSNNSRYYRWEYDETWIIHSKYDSFIILQTSPEPTLIQRPPDQQIYTCWISQRSSSIVLGSTAKLTSDVLNQAPVTLVASNSERLTSRYSILVKQYALTPEAYNYFDDLRKNTESLGSIFDPQPTMLTGNVHCVSNPAEQVIGYITAGSASQKRIYINRQQLPAGLQWQPKTPYDDCALDSAYYADPRTQLHTNEVARYLYTDEEIPVLPFGPPGHPPIGYSASSPRCVDCTLRGKNKPPAFWVDQ
jgi:hypothetical protein